MYNLKNANVETAILSYAILGNAKINIVIEMGLGSCIGEWWHIAKHLATKHTVLLYERAGCGTSGKSRLPRTPQNIVKELHNLLLQLPHENQITIVAHSQGGLYAQQYARCYPESVKSLILLDPLSANDNYFKKALTKDEYKKSGIDKLRSLNLQLLLARFHLGSIIKRLMKNAPPFYYFNGFTEESAEYILSTFTRPVLYKAAMEEYRLSHNDEIIASLKISSGFPDIPLCLLTHTSEISISETMEFGGVDLETALKIENIWQALMKEYLTFGKQTTFIQAKHSSHYIHLSEPELIYAELGV